MNYFKKHKNFTNKSNNQEKFENLSVSPQKSRKKVKKPINGEKVHFEIAQSSSKLRITCDAEKKQF